MRQVFELKKDRDLLEQVFEIKEKASETIYQYINKNKDKELEKFIGICKNTGVLLFVENAVKIIDKIPKKMHISEEKLGIENGKIFYSYEQTIEYEIPTTTKQTSANLVISNGFEEITKKGFLSPENFLMFNKLWEDNDKAFFNLIKSYEAIVGINKEDIKRLFLEAPEPIILAFKEYVKVIPIEGAAEQNLLLRLARDYYEKERQGAETSLCFCHKYPPYGRMFFYDFLNTSNISGRQENRLYVKVGSKDGIETTLVIPESDERLEALIRGELTHTAIVRDLIKGQFEREDPIKELAKKPSRFKFFERD